MEDLRALTENQITHNQFQYIIDELYLMATIWDKKMFADSLQVRLKSVGVIVMGRKCKKDWEQARQAYIKRHPEED